METKSLIEVFFPVLVIMAMFGLGLSLTANDFKRVANHPKAVTIALVNQLVFLPLTALLLVSIFTLKPELAVGFIIVASVPGGILSNVLTLLLKGDAALSVTLTALSSMISIVTIPFWVSLALEQFMNSTGSIHVPAADLVLPVAVLTLIPLILGLLIRARWPAFADSAKPAIKIGSGVFIFIGFVVFLIDQGENLVAYLVQAGMGAAVLCMTITLLGYGMAHLFKLRRSIKGTIAIESGIQNIPLAMTIAITILGDNPLFAVVPATYGLIMVVLMAVLMVGVIARWPSFQFSDSETK